MMMMENEGLRKDRLSDRILYALQLAIKQEDIKIADGLAKILEMSMTRNTGGGEFIERRDYPSPIEKALDKLDDLKKHGHE